MGWFFFVRAVFRCPVGGGTPYGICSKKMRHNHTFQLTCPFINLNSNDSIQQNDET